MASKELDRLEAQEAERVESGQIQFIGKGSEQGDQMRFVEKINREKGW
jgi:hypothetical protein